MNNSVFGIEFFIDYVRIDKGKNNFSQPLTSLPTWRETHHAEKYEGYLDFKQLKICAHVDI